MTRPFRNVLIVIVMTFSLPALSGCDAISSLFHKDSPPDPVISVLATWDGPEFGVPLSRPWDVVISADQRLFVADTGNNRVVVFDASGQWLDVFGTGMSPHQLGLLPDGHVLVSLVATTNIQIYSPSGNYETTVTQAGGVVFQSPIGVAVGSAHEIWVLDNLNGNAALIALDAQYHQTKSFTISNFHPGFLVRKPSGSLIVTDELYGELRQYSPDGYLEFSWKVPAYPLAPTGVAVDKSGRILVADSVTDAVLVYTVNGVKQFEFGGAGNGAGQFSRPMGMGVDIDGYVYVADSNNNRIQKIQLLK